MLTQVDITNVRSNTLSLFPLDSSNGYVVKEIDGLDPVNATLTTSTLAQVDGAEPQNARRDVRNITIKLGLEPDYVATTVQSLRQALYDYFMPKASVTLGFWLDGALFAITAGQVEDCQAPMFTSDPEVDISIVCYDPDFYDESPETFSAVTADPTPAPVSIGIADGTFESGVGDWTASNGGTLVQGTTAHSGTKGANLTLPASPQQYTYFRPTNAKATPITGGSPYGTKLWARQAVPSGTVSAVIDWRDSNQVYISTSSGTPVALVANTWTQLSTGMVSAPGNAAYAVHGPTVANGAANSVTSFDDLEFDAYVTNLNQQAIQYEGTSECGVIFQLAINRFMTDFTIYNARPDGSLQVFAVSGSFAPGDVVTVNSVRGQKALTLTRAGVTSSVLYYADTSNMDWPTLQKGENDFWVQSVGAAIPYTVTYTPKYGAI